MGDLQTMTAGVAQNDRKMFELNKAAGIANAVINAYQGISLTLASYPAPLSFAMAAVQGVAAFAQISAIRSANFQGGGGGTTPSLAGSVPTVNSTPVNSTETSESASSGGSAPTYNFYGDFVGNDSEKIFEELKSLISDGDHVLIESTSHNAQELAA